MFLTRAHFNVYTIFREAMPPGVRVYLRPFGSNPGLVEVFMESVGRIDSSAVDVGKTQGLKERAEGFARGFENTTERW